MPRAKPHYNLAMPDLRHHRGPHPEDATLFAYDQIDTLRNAVADLSWLLTRNYAANGAIKLVGDRYALTARQRNAVQRCACSNQSLLYRAAHHVEAGRIASRLLIDGYNVLTTIEAALANGFVFIARDGCARDIASIHGSYRKVDETLPALEIAGNALADMRIAHVTWYLDAPVSNSGRLKQTIMELASRRGWAWNVQILPDPDAALAQSPEVIATADSVILDRCARWYNLARQIVQAKLPNSRLVDLA